MRSGDAQESLPLGVATSQMFLHGGLTAPSLPVCCAATVHSCPCAVRCLHHAACLLSPSASSSLFSLLLQCVTSTCHAAHSQSVPPAAAPVMAVCTAP